MWKFLLATKIRVYFFLADWVRLCIAHCLDLVDASFDGNQKVAKKIDKCKYNIESGLGTHPHV
jgi:hypothetical protein